MQALNGTIQIMVRPKSGERLYAAKIMILVTGGSAHNAANAYLTAALKVFNVTIFVVAVTPKAKTVDNRALVVDDKHIFYLDDFTGLSSLPDMMLTTLCHGEGYKTIITEHESLHQKKQFDWTAWVHDP